MAIAFEVIHDPQAVLDYSFDWADWLAGQDTIQASSWSVSGSDLTLVIDSTDFTVLSATVWLSGGTVNRTYKVVNHITTAGGREDDRTLIIKVKNR